jgi:hypothetical protein
LVVVASMLLDIAMHFPEILVTCTMSKKMAGGLLVRTLSCVPGRTLEIGLIP